MNARENVVNVARRELVERVRDRTFLISTAVVVVILLIITVLPSLLGADERPRYTVGLVGAGAAPLAEALAGGGQAIGADVQVRRLPDAAAAAVALRAEELDLAVVDGRRLVALNEPPESLVGLVQAAARDLRVQSALRAAGVAPATIREALAERPLPLATLEPRRQGQDPGAGPREVVARFGSFVLYLQLITYGYWVASGVVEEKASRVVELLLATIRPAHLLAGKVIGIGLLGLGQLAFLALVGLGAALALDVIDVPASVLGTVATVLLWFLLGFAFYACAFAVAGAIVSRHEERQNTTTPLTLVMVAGFIVAVIAGGEPDSTIARVASFLPPVAPLVMLVRTAITEVPAWETVASVAVTAAATVALVPLAARIYAGAILRTGGRVKLRQALRSA